MRHDTATTTDDTAPCGGAGVAIASQPVPVTGDDDGRAPGEWRRGWPLVGAAMLGAGMGPFTAGDDPHSGRPAAQCVGQVAGQLGDLGALARCAVAVEGSPPRLGRHPIEGFDDRGHPVEPDRILQAEVGDVVQEVFDPTAGVGTDQDVFALVFGQLGQCGVQDADVVGGAVGPG